MRWRIKSLQLISAAGAILLAGSMAHAAAISIVGSPLSVSALDEVGTSFQYLGTVTPSDTISFSVTGLANLQAGPAYGTNAAGVVVTAGNIAGETIGTISDLGATETPVGSLILKINGIFSGPVFAANAANGLGSANPPQTLVFSGSLLALFSTFSSMTDPTFTFVIADEPAHFADNSGGFTVSSLSPASSSVPLPGAGWESLVGLAGVGLIALGKKVRRRLGAGTK